MPLSFGMVAASSKKNFKEESGLKARGQIALLRIFKELDMKENYYSPSKQIIHENKTVSFDLGISIDYEEIKTLQDKLKWVEAEDKFVSALKVFPNIFIILPFVFSIIISANQLV